MKVKYRDSIKYKVEKRVESMRAKVILRSDVSDIATYRQISRALQQLVKEEKLTKIAQGVYAKMRSSVISGEAVLDGAFTLIAREALDKLGVVWEPEIAEIEYNAGQSTQVPTNSRVNLKSRFNRKISWKNMELLYE